MKILFDPGHGTPVANGGKQSPDGRLKEPIYCRSLVAAMVDRLTQLGYDAECIVPESTDISLQERCERVNRYCAKLGVQNVIFLSIHVNAAGNGGWLNAQGWSIYTSRGQTKSDDLATCIFNAAREIMPNQNFRKDLTDNDPDIESGFYVLVHTQCPAILSENFFQDNRNDVDFLLSPKGFKSIVDTHVTGIINYLKSL